MPCFILGLALSLVLGAYADSLISHVHAANVLYSFASHFWIVWVTQCLILWPIPSMLFGAETER